MGMFRVAVTLAVISLVLNLSLAALFHYFYGSEMPNYSFGSADYDYSVFGEMSGFFTVKTAILSLITGNYYLYQFFGLDKVTLFADDFNSDHTINLAVILSIITNFIYVVGFAEYVRGRY